jgi:hypothetical protein
MPERDADKMAGKPERYRRLGGGTAESTAGAHQAGAACDEHVGEKTLMTMEEVVCRKNMLAAYQQVVGNQGARALTGSPSMH